MRLARVLAADRWDTSDPVWWRPNARSPIYVLLDREQAAALDAGISRPPLHQLLVLKYFGPFIDIKLVPFCPKILI
jgi:hypothetical protein